MKLIDLLKRNDPEAVVARLDAIYPDYASSHEGHLNAYRELLTLTPEADDGLIVTVSKVDPDPPLDDAWWDVSGTKPDDPIGYAIEFDPWPKWLGREVAPFDGPEVDLLSHILFEMTFLGYSSKDVAVSGGDIIARGEAAIEGLSHD